LFIQEQSNMISFLLHADILSENYEYKPVMKHAENATLKFEENGNVII